MKSIIISILLAVSSFLLAQVSETRSLNNFTEIEVKQGIALEITQNKTSKVEVFTDTKAKLSHIITEVKGNKLVVRIDKKNFVKDKLKSNTYKILRVEISLPTLTKLHSQSGASVMLNNTISAHNFELKTQSGASVKGDFDIAKSLRINTQSGAFIKGNVKCTQLEVKTSSGASVKLNGTTQQANYNAQSGSNIDAENVIAQSVFAKGSTSAYITLHAENTLSANANTVAEITYSGNPTVTEKTSTLGKITKL